MALCCWKRKHTPTSFVKEQAVSLGFLCRWLILGGSAAMGIDYTLAFAPDSRREASPRNESAKCQKRTSSR